MQDKFRDTIIYFTKDQIALAKHYAIGLQENLGRNTHPLSEERDLVGALGQIAVAYKLKHIPGIKYVCYNPYVPRQRGDFGDGRINGEIFDVKSRYIREDKYLTNLFGDCNILEIDKEDVEKKNIASYIFVNIALGDEPKAYIIGAISTMKFWSTARRNDKLKMTGYFVKGMETKPLINFVYHA
jgi:hypothetical protein